MLVLQENIYDQKATHTKISEKTENILFSDAQIFGEFTLDELPFSIHSILSMKDGMRGAALLRHCWYECRGDTGLQYETKTKSSFDTGQEVSDDIGCLISLLLGIRIRASGKTKWLRRHEGVWKETLLDYPSIPEGFDQAPHSSLVVPWAKPGKKANLNDLRAIRSIADIDSEELVELVRGAKLFSSAVWYCEIDPSLAWLQLISALEAFAFLYSRSQSPCPLEAFQNSDPELFKRIEKIENPELLHDLAMKLKNTTQSTKKFLDFCKRYHHEAPNEDLRPPKAFQVNWSPNGWKKILNTVYGYRSSFLHAGKPMPFPMSLPPHQSEFEEESELSGKYFAEKPIGLASHSGPVSYAATDTPVTLNTFMEFSHGVLRNYLVSKLE